jgi:putative ABC transport system substrate-binding protein
VPSFAVIVVEKPLAGFTLYCHGRDRIAALCDLLAAMSPPVCGPEGGTVQWNAQRTVRAMPSVLARTKLTALEVGARQLGLDVLIVYVKASTEIDSAFAKIVGDGAQALVVLADPITFTQRWKIAELAARNRLPAVYGPKEYAEAGGLMFYWAEETTLYQRTAAYVDKILKGAKPSDLPIEQPTRFALVINAKTAKELDLIIPPSLLARADEVIE